MDDLKYSELREANIKRLPLFKNKRGSLAHSKPDGSDWTPLEWIGAAVGELGECANRIKKVKRGDVDLEEERIEIGKEIADVAIYLDLLAYQYRLDLGKLVRDKFNEVSDRVGVDVKL